VGEVLGQRPLEPVAALLHAEGLEDDPLEMRRQRLACRVLEHAPEQLVPVP
jgi:hypothetical protein